jgi:predicted permease
MTHLRQDLRIAVRSLRKRPGFTAVAVLTLALGAGLTTAIFSLVYGVLLRPLPFEDSARIAALWQMQRDNPAVNLDGSISHLNYLDWKAQARSFESMGLFAATRFVVTGLGEAELVRGALATSGFFETFGARPVRGRTFTREDDLPGSPRVIVVGHGFWQERLGGREDAVGQSLEISGQQWEIVGIAPRGFDFPRDAKLWRPMRADDGNCGRDCVYMDGVAKLGAGVTLAAARDEVDAIARRLEREYPDANANVTIGIATLQDVLVGDVKPALRLLLAAVCMVLLIACANVANLLLARGTARHTEMAIRAALGASRRRLVEQLSAESLVLAALGAALGLLLAVWSIDFLRRLAPPGVPRLNEIGLDVATFLFATGLVVLTAALCGLGPGVQLLRVPLVASLGEGSRAIGSGGARAKAALLAAEVALSLVLLLGAGLFLRSFVRLQAVDPGWRSDDLTVFTLSLPPARYDDAVAVRAAYDEIDRRLSALPGVERAGRIQGLPLGPIANVLSFARPDRPAPPPGQGPIALNRTIDADYFPAMGIPILAGRNFTPADRDGSPPVIIISRAMAQRFWPGEDPIGTQVAVSGQPTRTVVGIAGDVRSERLASAPAPEMYWPHAQDDARVLSLVVKSRRGAGQVLADARVIVQAFDPNLPLIGPGTMQQLVDDALAQPRFYLLLLSLFATLAVVLAAVGIYGVVAYVAGQRRREIGVRMALGAGPADVVGLVVWQGLKPALLGAAIGLAVALGGSNAVGALLYEVSPRDAVVMTIVTVVLLIVVVLACMVPAARATRVPPTTALRAQ